MNPEPVLVVFGASAGGIVAAGEFLAGIHADAPVTVVIAQHLAPLKRSALPEILAARSVLKVEVIEDGQKPLRGHVYVPPSGLDVVLHNGRLWLRRPKPRVLPAPLIDALLHSVVDEGIAHRCISVIASGLGADGAAGVRAVTAAGGIAMAQNPADAGSASMPEAALATGRVDLMGPVQALAQRISAVARAIDAPSASIDRQSLRMLDSATTLWGNLGMRRFDPAVLARAVQLRAVLRDADTTEAYAEILRKDPGEAAALQRNLLRPVSTFDSATPGRAEMMQLLVNAYAEWRGPGLFRVWSVGCASGEEAYAMAFELEKCRREKGLDPYRVYGTDILSDRISLARTACYSHDEVAGLERRCQLKFMVPRLRYFQVDLEIRRNVLFAVHDALRNPPVTRTQFICCRGVARRLREQSRVQLQERLLGAMSPGGTLVLEGQVFA